MGRESPRKPAVRRHLGAGLLALGLLVTSACSITTGSVAPETTSAPPPVNLSGKTVRVLINFSAGGPTDVFGRHVARYLSKHIPGNPTLIVENMAGAGGNIGSNYMYNQAKDDGLTIGIYTAITLTDILKAGTKEVQYKASDFKWIGASGETSVILVNPGVAKNTDEIYAPNGQLVVGGLNVAETKDLTMLTSLDLIGVKAKYITGYPGVAEIRQAFQSGEVNWSTDTLAGYFTGDQPFIERGLMKGIMQEGLLAPDGTVMRDPRVDLPTIVEVAKQKNPQALETDTYRAYLILMNKGSLIRNYILPPTTSPEIVEALAKG